MNDICIPKFDHHCIWINNGVGEGNYKYFYTFLVVHLAYCSYGLLLGFASFVAYTQDQQLLSAVFENTVTRQKMPATLSLVLQYLFDKYLELAFCNIIHFVCTVMLVVFTIYHTYLLYTNSTTAEGSKYSEYTSYYSKKIKLLDWIKSDKEEVKSMFCQKELDMYTIDLSKIDDEKYIEKSLANAKEIMRRLDDWPYSKQSFKQTLREVFLEN